MPICSWPQDYVINWILNTTVPRQKLNLGLPFYGISLNLSDPHNTQLGAPITGKAPGGDLMGVTGTMAYYEVLAPVPFVSLPWRFPQCRYVSRCYPFPSNLCVTRCYRFPPFSISYTLLSFPSILYKLHVVILSLQSL